MTLVDTGDATQTGGRLKRVLPYVDRTSRSCLTYGDGVADIDIAPTDRLSSSAHGRWRPSPPCSPAGASARLTIDGDARHRFRGEAGRRRRLDQRRLLRALAEGRRLIDGDATIWEARAAGALGASGELRAYVHHGFWQPMDTLRDRTFLEELWDAGKAPWKVW